MSQITDYRLGDWLKLFGFNLADIAYAQVRISNDQTTVVDSTVYDPDLWVPWFRARQRSLNFPTVAPLSQLVEPALPISVDHQPLSRDSFLYVKIGRKDAVAFPELTPGSIVRVRISNDSRQPNRTSELTLNGLYLVEYETTLFCCRLRHLTNGGVGTISPQLPCPTVELDLGGNARILGTADLEIRPLRAGVVPSYARIRRDRSLKLDGTLPKMLQAARRRAGLTFRQASALSKAVAEALADSRYFASSAFLSDCETSHTAPRHCHKALTLCAIYGLTFETFLESAGMSLDRAGRLPMPVQEHLPHRSLDLFATASLLPASEQGDFMEELIRRVGDVPWFLHHSLEHLFGLPHLSMNDIFWAGGSHTSLHPALTGSILLVVNRRRKTAHFDPEKPVWDQPLYLLRVRDGSYLFGCCDLKHNFLTVYNCMGYVQVLMKVKNDQEAELVGQLVAVVRQLA